MAASRHHPGILVLLLVVGVVGLLASVALARPNYRGVPLGPCITGSATHYNDSYMWNPKQGGTCGLNPIKYTKLGNAVATSDALYYSFGDGRASGCGVCYEVYGANGARNIIVADVGSAGGTDLNLLRSGNSVWEDITNNAGMGNVGVTYRQVTCPSVDDRHGGSMVTGNIKAQWQSSGANNFYWEIHFWDHIVGIKSMTVNSSLHTSPVAVSRKVSAQNAFAWIDSGDIGVPFTMTIKSFDGQTLSKTIGTVGQTIAQIAGSGGKVFDFGSQFQLPSGNSYADDGDCRPPALPKAIYKDDFQGKSGVPSVWMLISQYSATVAADHTSNCFEGSRCISVAYQRNGGMIVGSVFHYMKNDFTGVSFYVRGDAPVTGLALQVASQKSKVSFNATTSWQKVTVNFADYADIPDFMDKAYFYFTSSTVGQVYFDDINLFGGDGTAHYFPTARVFTSASGSGGGGGDSVSAASTLSSTLGHILF